MSDWEQLYRRWRELERTWSPDRVQFALDDEDDIAASRNQEILKAVFDVGKLAANRPHSVGVDVWNELIALGKAMDAAEEAALPERQARVVGLLRELDPETTDHARRLEAETLAERPGLNRLAPYDDPYHAALFMARKPFIYRRHADEWYFRGQNGIFPLVAGAYREGDDASIAIARVRTFVRDLKYQFSELSGTPDLELASIAQHYITRTWMLDFSGDPYVALYFTTDPLLDGEIAQHLHLRAEEWNAWSVHGTNAMGQLARVDVRAPRILSQDWISLTAEPALLARAATRDFYVLQQAGCEFSDSTRERPISTEEIYPSATHDEYRAFAETWKKERGEIGRAKYLPTDESAPALDCEPPTPAPISAALFADITASWVESTVGEQGMDLTAADYTRLAIDANQLGQRWGTLLTLVDPSEEGAEYLSFPELRRQYKDVLKTLSGASLTIDQRMHTLYANLRRSYPVEHPVIQYLEEVAPGAGI